MSVLAGISVCYRTLDIGFDAIVAMALGIPYIGIDDADIIEEETTIYRRLRH